MAIGLARMFNVRFPLNFNSPYKATSLIDYWQRWHMTLTRLSRCYVYTRLRFAITRRRAAHGLQSADRRRAANRSGFAQHGRRADLRHHGAWRGFGTAPALQFLVFGLLHAVYICRQSRSGASCSPATADRPLPACRIMRPGSADLSLRSGRSLRVPCAVSPGAASCWAAWSGCTGYRVAFDNVRVARDVVWLAALYAIVWGAPNTQQIMRDHAPALGRINPGPLAALRWQPNLRWAAACGFAATLGLLSMGGTGEFLYFQF